LLYQLNSEQRIVKAATHFVPWIVGRVNYLLEQKQLPYVDTNFLAKGLQRDESCSRLGVGQTRADAERWLNAAASAGILAKKVRPHELTRTNQIDTWWPAGTRQTGQV
jgi:hypothetical protein